MSFLKRLFTPAPDPRETLRPLYDAVVAEARRPDWYRAGVADTVAGRFDMVSAVLAAVLVRMERSPELVAPSVLLTELFIHDMDGQMREFGVGDVIVGKHVGKLVSAMGGRLDAYRMGLGGNDATLDDALRRNVTLSENANVGAIAADMRTFASRLDRTTDQELLGGRIAA